MTVYVPLAVTTMSSVDSAVDQELPLVAEELRVTDPPAQKVVGPPAVITGAAGIGFTVTVTGAEAGETHPFASVCVTVKIPLLLTVMEFEVAPPDHKLPEL